MTQKRIPKKLTTDAIVEAIFEMRFDTETIPEVLFGRLADDPNWKTLTQRRLPAYDIPAPMRAADPNLRYQAVFELSQAQSNTSVRVGPQVLSYHQRAPYGGWTGFKPKLQHAIELLFSKSDPTITRLGLRYLNSLRPELHHIGGIADIDMSVVAAERTISEKVNVNYTTSVSPDMNCTVRVATPDFVVGGLPPTTAVFIDVDVYTIDGFSTKDVAAVRQWLERAHEEEKKSFFGLLKTGTIEALAEE